jgi:hypothetical protein
MVGLFYPYSIEELLFIMNHRLTYKTIGIALAVFVIAIIAIFAWLYTGKINSAKEKVLNILPAPIAFVDNRAILMGEFSSRLAISSKLNTQNPPLGEAALRQNVFDGLIQQQKIGSLAAKFGVSVNNKELDNEYKQAVANTNLPEGQKFNDLLKVYGLDEQSFKTLLLKPELLKTKLKVWFYNQRNLNQPAYQTADGLLEKLNNGGDFAYLAKNFSQEPTSQALNGDMGYVKISDLLPELSESVDGMAVGQTKIVASRYGLHVIKLLEKNNNNPQNTAQFHLTQIFVQAADFEQWLGSETKNIKVKILINPA